MFKIICYNLHYISIEQYCSRNYSEPVKSLVPPRPYFRSTHLVNLNVIYIYLYKLMENWRKLLKKDVRHSLFLI